MEGERAHLNRKLAVLLPGVASNTDLCLRLPVFYIQAPFLFSTISFRNTLKTKRPGTRWRSGPLLCLDYLLWQQLSLQLPLQQVWPSHFWWQQSLQ